ncbi:MAG: hypothetical protein A3G83_16060 [Betaproteobacteria bacterium RIFCSPLOWO2_12_FULL_68_20]|nr:MAG: hypothetical protein A3G83_16060 [Betaproteobacteria bacterium RIFCSPLOWO2_12_FULL_68_20]
MKASKLTAHKTLYWLVAVTVIAIGFGVYRSQEKAAQPQVPRQEQPAQAGALVSLRPSFDFGTVSMAAGNVSYRYLIKNNGAAPLSINRIYTSCMCTNATLITASGRTGPFGMPGHGLAPAVSSPLAPGEVASLEVVFDPAAHGPTGVGRVERTVTLQSRDAQPLELRFVAMVTP